MKILITGICGTLGAEFYRQLKKDNEVFGIDANEWAVAERNDPNIFLGDYRHHKGSYDLIIHCAAYKHIELCETNKDACIRNNVLNLVWAYKNIQGKWLFISTDKAVEPSSVYGQAKQLAENFFKDKGEIVARLGNIYKSSGSVIPLWEKQYSEGKPLTITDPAMTRYFIKVDKAVESILELWKKTKAGDTIIPELGQPVKLKDMVKQLYGDYPTRIIGLRPGEKMREKLKWDWEITKFKNKYGTIIR